MAYGTLNAGTIDPGSGNTLTIDGAWTAASQTCANLGTVTTADINGGTIDGPAINSSAIGASSHTTGKFTTCDATTDFTIGGLVVTDGNIADTGTLAIVPVDGCTIALGSDAGDDFNIDGGKLFVEGDTGNTQLDGTILGTALLSAWQPFDASPSGWSPYAATLSSTGTFTTTGGAGGPYRTDWTYVNGRRYQVHIVGTSNIGFSFYTGWSPSKFVFGIGSGSFDVTFEMSPMTETTQGGAFLRHGENGVTTITSMTIHEVTGGQLRVNGGKVALGHWARTDVGPDTTLHIKSNAGTNDYGIITDLIGMSATASSIYFHAFRQNGTSVGYLWNNSSNDFVVATESDEKLKKNVRDAEYGLEEVLSLRPVSFDWKEPIPEDRPEVKDNPVDVVERKDIKGFIAQEVEKVVPEAVGDSPEGNKILSVTTFIPILTKAIQQLSAKVSALENA